MTKADLKTGMILEDGYGSLGLVLLDTNKGDIVVRISGRNYFLMNLLEDDLRFTKVNKDRKEDIMKVYDGGSNKNFLKEQCQGRELIWERQEETTMTISEIEEKLGIKNLKIKKC